MMSGSWCARSKGTCWPPGWCWPVMRCPGLIWRCWRSAIPGSGAAAAGHLRPGRPGQSGAGHGVLGGGIPPVRRSRSGLAGRQLPGDLAGIRPHPARRQAAAGLLSLQVTAAAGRATGSAWEGMSGAVVFAADAHDGEQAAVGVISTHHRPEGESALTVVPVTAVAELAAAATWWQQFGVPGPDTLPSCRASATGRGWCGPTSAAGRPLEEVTDPFVLEVHRPVQPEDAPSGLPVLPPYVPREHDQVLGQVVAAAAGGRSGIAVLVGGSSTGKTRACWEALDLLRDRPGRGGCGTRSTRPAPMRRCASWKASGLGPWCGLTRPSSTSTRSRPG